MLQAPPDDLELGAVWAPAPFSSRLNGVTSPLVVGPGTERTLRTS